MKPNSKKIESLITELLVEIGEDPHREGLLKTPQRVAQAIEFLTSGTRVDAQKLINGAVFTQATNSMVIVKNIEVYSLCEHHMLPFFGRCHIGYIPSGRVFGVSKLARLVQLGPGVNYQAASAILVCYDANRLAVDPVLIFPRL